MTSRLEITRNDENKGNAPAWDDDRHHARITIHPDGGQLDGAGAAPVVPMPVRIGDAPVAARRDAIERRAVDDGLGKARLLTADEIHIVAAEPAEAARRLQLVEKVEAYVRVPSPQTQAAADVPHRADVGSAVIITRLVNRLGKDLEPVERIDVPREASLPDLAAGEFPPLPADLATTAPERSRLDARQNRRLGQLVEWLRG